MNSLSSRLAVAHERTIRLSVWRLEHLRPAPECRLELHRLELGMGAVDGGQPVRVKPGPQPLIRGRETARGHH